MFDYIVVGAGFSGLTIAERVATQLKKRVLIIEKRNHIGGNCYDSYNEDGILIHTYGPRVFHTNDKEVWDYVSQFTEWKVYQHKTLIHIEGQDIPFPININSIEKLFSNNLAQSMVNKLVVRYGHGNHVLITELLTSGDDELIWLANFVVDKAYANSIRKQLNLDISTMPEFMLDKIYITISRDDRHYSDKYQGIPRHGYNQLFKHMLNDTNVKVMLNADYNEFISLNAHTKQIKFMGQPFQGKLIYTAKLDELFDFCYGELPYRTIDFKFKKYNKEHVQSVATINYPNEYDFTRRTEVKYLTGQNHPQTFLVEEYHRACLRKDIPYYPIVTNDNVTRHQQYLDLANSIDNLITLGNLANFQHLDMSSVVKNSLSLFAEYK